MWQFTHLARDVSVFILVKMHGFVNLVSGKGKTAPVVTETVFGGNMWESNPPGRLLATHNGFEDRGAHQHPSTPVDFRIIQYAGNKCKLP